MKRKIKELAGVREADVRNYATRASMLAPQYHNRRFAREVGFSGALPLCPLSYGDHKEPWPGAGPVR